MKSLGYDVDAYDMSPIKWAYGFRKLINRLLNIFFRLGLPVGLIDFDNLNSKIQARVHRGLDLIWIDKGMLLTKATLSKIKEKSNACLVGYSPDDMCGRHNQTQQYIDHVGHYDIFFTTKSYRVETMRNNGYSKVYFVENAFCPNAHRPLQVTKLERTRLGGSVGFIGSFEKERWESIQSLVESGISVRIWGNGWSHIENLNPLLRIEDREIILDEYALAISSFDISLCFLRKINLDQQTTRSIEIPACGGFLLAERTREHASLFKEGEEAEFFGSQTELLSKTIFYLAHQGARKKIAAAGRARCLKDGYSYPERMSSMLTVALGANSPP